MNTLDIVASGASLGDAVKTMGEQPLALMEGKRPVAVMMPVGNCDLESISLSVNPKFLAMLRASDRSYYEKGGISMEEMRRLVAEMPDNDGAAKKRPRSKRAAKK